MNFEWNEEKRLANIDKHSLDFIDAVDIFENPHLRERARPVASEQRWIAVGSINGRYATAIYTMRGDTIRIISLRRARHDEQERYKEVFGI